MEVFEPKALHDIEHGVIEGKDVVCTKKYFHEIAYLYQNAKIDGDPVVYDVYSYSQQDEHIKGNLNWGLTILKPIYIHDECNMTKGHFHVDRQCAEFYFGIEGEGLLLLMDEDGHTYAEKVFKGSLHHIDGHVAHRLVNIGDSDLKVGACWPTTAGHDYEAIQNREFGYRIFKRQGKLEFEKR